MAELQAQDGRVLFEVALPGVTGTVEAVTYQGRVYTYRGHKAEHLIYREVWSWEIEPVTYRPSRTL